MTELDAFNQMRALMGLPPVNSTATQSRSVAILQDSLDRARKRIIRKAWRKFAAYVTLTPDINGEIAISQYLRVVYPQGLNTRLTERNGLVWDIQANAAYSEAIDGAFVLEDISFEQISSDSWQEYIVLEAAAEMYQRTSDADQNLVLIMQQRRTARQQAYNESKICFNIGARSMRGFYR